MAATTAAQVFALMAQAVDEVGPTLVPKVKGVIKFDVTGAGLWLVDLKNGSGKVASASAADKADIVITVRFSLSSPSLKRQWVHD